MNQDKVGKYIYNLRSKNKMTQGEFATKIGVTAQAVSKWENGRGIPDIEILKIISNEFNVSIDSILGNKKKSYIWIVIFGIVLVLGIIIMLFLFKNEEYNLGVIKSGNDEFIITGAASYSSDKKSIHITDINYIREDENLYELLEFSLYETEGDITKKLIDGRNVDISVDFKDGLLINELIDSADLYIDNYNSICSDLENPNLFIRISLLSESGLIINHEVPLVFDYTC